MHIVHLTSSFLFGGPERQLLGLAEALPDDHESTFLSFREGGRCRAFLDEAKRRGFPSIELDHDTPNLRAAGRELTHLLADIRADVLLCHGYKPNLLGRGAARRVGIPVVAVSRGWTGENFKVRLYEGIDRSHLRYMDRVVCVAEGQARKVRRAGVPPRKVVVIHNSARLNAFAEPDPNYRTRLREFFPDGWTDRVKVIAAAGRLGPEKGFDVLVRAARFVCDGHPDARFVLFGGGEQRPMLERLVAENRLRGRFIMAGFRTDLDKFLPWVDLLAISSHTEGLSNVALEASAAGVPVVATRVGGNPEVVRHGETGLLVRPGDAGSLATALLRLLRDDDARRDMGTSANRLMHDEFTFRAQADAYRRLCAELAGTRSRRTARVA